MTGFTAFSFSLDFSELAEVLEQPASATPASATAPVAAAPMKPRRDIWSDMVFPFLGLPVPPATVACRHKRKKSAPLGVHKELTPRRCREEKAKQSGLGREAVRPRVLYSNVPCPGFPPGSLRKPARAVRAPRRSFPFIRLSYARCRNCYYDSGRLWACQSQGGRHCASCLRICADCRCGRRVLPAARRAA